MKRFTAIYLVGIILLFVVPEVPVVHAQIVELVITGSWLESDFDVSSTGPDSPVGDPEGNDDLVFGVAPSDGSTTFSILVDTSTSTALFPAGYLSTGGTLTHDWIGYTDVTLVGTHTFGSATWENDGIVTGLVGVDGLTAALWSDTDITTGNPSRIKFRMFGEGDDLSADIFFGSGSSANTISTGFLLWEYFGGEEIRSNSYTVTRAIISIPVDIDIDPDTLNLKSKGEWITCYLSPGDGDATNIDVPSIRLEDTLEVQQSDILDGVLMVKFGRSDVQTMLSPGEQELTVTGEFTDGQTFQCSDTIRVIDPGD